MWQINAQVNFFCQVNYQDKFEELEILELWTSAVDIYQDMEICDVSAKMGSPHSRRLEITGLMHSFKTSIFSTANLNEAFTVCQPLC